MKILALIIGAVAAVAAALALGFGSLGSIDLGAAALAGLNERQLTTVRIGLTVLAGLPFLGAGLAIGAPRSGALVLLLSALGWGAAIYLLGHPFELLAVLPAGLSFVAAILTVVGGIADVHRAEREAAAEPDWVESPVFAAASNVTPLPTRQPPPVIEDGEPDLVVPDLRVPRPRRVVDPEPEEDDDDDESAFGHFAVRAAGLLSFLLYAGLFGAGAYFGLAVERQHPRIAVTETTPAPASAAPTSLPPLDTTSSAPAADVLELPTGELAPLLPFEPTSSTLPSASESVADTRRPSDVQLFPGYGVVVAPNRTTRAVQPQPPRVSSSEPPGTIADLLPLNAPLASPLASEVPSSEEQTSLALVTPDILPPPEPEPPPSAASSAALPSVPVVPADAPVPAVQSPDLRAERAELPLGAATN